MCASSRWGPLSAWMKKLIICLRVVRWIIELKYTAYPRVMHWIICVDCWCMFVQIGCHLYYYSLTTNAMVIVVTIVKTIVHFSKAWKRHFASLYKTIILLICIRTSDTVSIQTINYTIKYILQYSWQQLASTFSFL